MPETSLPVDMHPVISFKLRGWILVCGLSLAAARGADDAGTSAGMRLRAETFDTVWQVVNDSHFDPSFGGVDWAAQRERYRPAALAAADAPAFREVLRALLGELRQSHLGIIPAENSVFDEEARRGTGDSGLRLALAGDRVVVERIAADSPAAAAGLAPGSILHAIDGRLLSALRTKLAGSSMTPAMQDFFLVVTAQRLLGGAPGDTVALTLEPFGAASRDVTLTLAPYAGRWSEPLGRMPATPVEVESRTLPGGAAYLRFNLFAPAVMPDIRRTILEAARRGAPGLVIDLRGNPGGVALMVNGIVGLLSARELTLGTMTLRSGHLNTVGFPQEGAFPGPVAVLVDGRSASCSEILSAGLQECGRARVFGSPTAGAALVSMFRPLPNRDTLQHPIADFHTAGGRVIEGRGCIPDEPVPLQPAALAAGRDPVLDAAGDWLARAAPPR